jgi:hypothetical protein
VIVIVLLRRYYKQDDVSANHQETASGVDFASTVELEKETVYHGEISKMEIGCLDEHMIDFGGTAIGTYLV